MAEEERISGIFPPNQATSHVEPEARVQKQLSCIPNPTEVRGGRELFFWTAALGCLDKIVPSKLIF